MAVVSSGGSPVAAGEAHGKEGVKGSSPLEGSLDAGGGSWTLDSGGEHGRSLAELGIGTNPAAVVTGNVLEDEKVIHPGVLEVRPREPHRHPA